MKGMYEEGSEGLETGSRERLKQLLLTYQGIFSEGPHDIGKTSLIKHKINTGDLGPVKQPHQRTPIHYKRESRGELDKILKVRESTSEWASPICLVGKKGEGSDIVVTLGCLMR